MQETYIEGQTFNRSDKLQKADYEDCVFNNIDFSNQNLSGFSFVDCVFKGCNLSLTKVVKTIFRDVIFINCKMLGLHFESCETFGLSFSFEDCQLNHASFYNTKIHKTVFQNSQLLETDFTEADLTEAVFDNCNLNAAVFNQTILEKADFLTAYNYTINPELNHLKKAKLSVQGLPGLLKTYDLQLEDYIDLSRAAPATNGRAAGPPEGVGKAGYHLTVDQPDELIDFLAVCSAQPEKGAAAEITQKGVGDFRLLFTPDIGQQTLNDGADQFIFCSLRPHAGRSLQKTEQIIALAFGKIVGRRQKEQAQQNRCGRQADDPKHATTGCIGQTHDHAGHAAPPVAVQVLDLLIAHETVGGGGQHHNGHQQRADNGRGNDNRQVGKQLTGLVLQKHHRQKDGHRGDGRGQKRTPHLARAAIGRLHGRASVLALAHDVFQHHNGRIQHQTGGKRQPGQRNDVERAPGRIQHQKGKRQAQRNGQTHHQRGAHSAEKPPQHQHRQAHAHQQIGDHHAHRLLDVDGVVADLLNLKTGRAQLGFFQKPDLLLDVVHDLEHVDARLGNDVDANGRPAIERHDAR